MAVPDDGAPAAAGRRVESDDPVSLDKHYRRFAAFQTAHPDLALPEQITRFLASVPRGWVQLPIASNHWGAAGAWAARSWDSRGLSPRLSHLW